MGNQSIEELGYSLLKDLQFEIAENQTSLIFCFWVYLPTSTAFPSTILHQMDSEKPLLSLNGDKRLMLSPSVISQDESSGPGSIDTSTEGLCAISNVELPLGRWAHIGCEVRSDIISIHLDGKVVGERPLDSSAVKVFDFTLSATCKGFKGLDGYVHNVAVLPSSSSIKEHHVKDPPLWLSIDSSSALNIEPEDGEIWKIVGGKESCRKMFSLDALLLDAFGEPVDKELEVVTSLIYADDHFPIEKSINNEAPLLTTCNGIEFPSNYKPNKLQQGRASFQLSITRLSSECDNKLFRVKFNVLSMGCSPFLEAFTPPIRCIDKTSDTKKSTITWKKLPSGVHLVNGSSSPQFSVGHSELVQKAVCEAIPTPPLKRKKVGQDNSLPVSKSEPSEQAPDEECSSYAAPATATKAQNAVKTSLESIQENYGGLDNSASDSESVGARTSELKNISSNREYDSDLTIFRYCLGGFSERSLMLKEICSYASEKDMEVMAEKVSFFSGCSHHRYQIMIAKKLLEEGEKAWNLISQNSNRVQWDNAVFGIEEQFMRIACCSSRSLTQQDLNFLRKISGGHEYLVKDDFDKMWRWLYPVAYTISRNGINALWSSVSPMWIEGFVTKEEVEYALQNPLGIQEPGTFILRFPTTRSWPHPDAGSLVASYVSKDFSLRHRQLSLDYSAGIFDTNQKPVQELLLSEPELSRVGRIARSHLTI
ncbi:unnamed protein product [Amaranthus hypochondriacus]